MGDLGCFFLLNFSFSALRFSALSVLECSFVHVMQGWAGSHWISETYHGGVRWDQWGEGVVDPGEMNVCGDISWCDMP
jgi:apolipoprotein N-acyltransferase